MSQIWPRMWLSSRTSRAAGRALAARSSMSMVSASVVSTKTGSAPTLAIAPGTGASVKPFDSTLSPGPTPIARSAQDMA
jgi:hypothetical protein